jgi:diamine N-acetyltransferase
MLQGEKIRLRALDVNDLDFVHACENNSALWHLGATVQPFSKAVIADYIESAQLDIYAAKQLRMMIDTLDGRTIGMIDIYDFDPKNSKAGIGILIAETSDRQQGHAKDALMVLCDHCFNILGLHQVYCHIATDNAASLALFRAAGFEESGLLKDWVRLGSRYQSAAVMQRMNTF